MATKAAVEGRLLDVFREALEEIRDSESCPAADDEQFESFECEVCGYDSLYFAHTEAGRNWPAMYHEYKPKTEGCPCAHHIAKRALAAEGSHP